MANIQNAARETREDHDRRRIRVARLQADLAYFYARLGMIGTPRTPNQAGQKVAFKTLMDQLGSDRGRAIYARAIARRPD